MSFPDTNAGLVDSTSYQIEWKSHHRRSKTTLKKIVHSKNTNGPANICTCLFLNCAWMFKGDYFVERLSMELKIDEKRFDWAESVEVENLPMRPNFQDSISADLEPWKKIVYKFIVGSTLMHTYYIWNPISPVRISLLRHRLGLAWFWYHSLTQPVSKCIEFSFRIISFHFVNILYWVFTMVYTFKPLPSEPFRQHFHPFKMEWKKSFSTFFTMNKHKKSHLAVQRN